MTLPYIWANVQPLKWLLNNLNIDMAGKANGSAAGQTEMVTMASVKVGKGGGGDLGCWWLERPTDGFTAPFTATNPTQPNLHCLEKKYSKMSKI